ncbi:MAG: DUF3971 domain-containing protein [Proteobacteria bacterium]|nr:DUF3971 domain-containing protein [Pseudomonadota bacterium]NBX86103.1 DUF3971 domain-containing protein [Pseudomonadota bacterium]
MGRVARRNKVVAWCSLGTLVVALVVVVLSSLALGWVAQNYSKAHPLDLGPYAARLESYLAERGVRVSFGKIEAYYDGSPVIRVEDVQVKGPDGELGIYVEKAAVKLANRMVMMLNVSPKMIEAQGVTLRVVRDAGGIRLAGLRMVDSTEDMASNEGLVEWLGAMASSSLWHRLKTVNVQGMNLLLRDEVQQAEWVLEDATLLFSRYADDGERGTLNAQVRRLYGEGFGPREQGIAMPVLVTFDRAAGADFADLNARFDQTDVALVADYLPPIIRDMLRAQGSVEIGSQLMRGNRLGQPWVTLRLARVVVQPPKGFSRPLEFPRLTLTAAYQPSPTDVLELKNLVVQTERGNIWRASGRVEALTTDPLVSATLASVRGDVQGIFDFFPDQARGFDKTLRWVRPNIKGVEYRGLTARYVGRPSAFPGCGDACGELVIDADMVAREGTGSVKFLPELPPVEFVSGSFAWRGQEFAVRVPAGKVAAQQVKDVEVRLTHIFERAPTHILVSGTLRGDTPGLMREIAKLDDKGEVPTDVGGSYVVELGVDIPLVHGQEATFATSHVVVSGTLADLRLAGMPELKGAVLRAPKAEVRLFADKSLRLAAEGTLGNQPLALVWQRNILRDAPRDKYLNVQGTMEGAWLQKVLENPTWLNLSGPLDVAANLRENKNGQLFFGVRANAARGRVGVPFLNYEKHAGVPLVVEVQGSHSIGTVASKPSKGNTDKVELTSLRARGEGVNVSATLRLDMAKLDASRVVAEPLRVGDSDAKIDWRDGKLVVRGSKLDIAGMELFDHHEEEEGDIENLQVDVQVDELIGGRGQGRSALRNVQANLQARNSVWDIERLTGVVEGGSQVSLRMINSGRNQRKLMLNIENVGTTLAALGIYGSLRGGKLWGDIVYTAPQVGSGQLKMEGFELKNPPLMMKILGLISLEQLVAGTDTTLFQRAVLPLRLDGERVYLNEAKFEGPSMNIQLDGSYVRKDGTLDFNGRLAPGIPLNRLVAKIPVVGTLLTGSQDGVVVADFRLSGPSDDPQVSVRPLSVLTPGLVKDLWRGLMGGR